MTQELQAGQLRVGQQVFEIPADISVTQFSNGNVCVLKERADGPFNGKAVVASVQPRAERNGANAAIIRMITAHGAKPVPPAVA